LYITTFLSASLHDAGITFHTWWLGKAPVRRRACFFMQQHAKHEFWINISIWTSWVPCVWHFKFHVPSNKSSRIFRIICSRMPIDVPRLRRAELCLTSASNSRSPHSIANSNHNLELTLRSCQPFCSTVPRHFWPFIFSVIQISLSTKAAPPPPTHNSEPNSRSPRTDIPHPAQSFQLRIPKYRYTLVL
jgi:hypothetical protein